MSNSTAKEYATDRLRNVALLGHTSAGKTTFAEALLFAAGNTTRLGSVDDGTTVSDFDAEEKRRKQSVYLSLAPVEWKGYKFNLLDAPGYADFYGEANSHLAHELLHTTYTPHGGDAARSCKRS
jgi:elongation factor G